MAATVLVQMKSRAVDENGVPMETGFTSRGSLTEEDGIRVLRFTERLRDEAGEETERNTELRLDPDGIGMRQSGGFGFDGVIFRAGERCGAVYHTPFGEMDMTLLVDRAEHMTTPAGGRISLRYALEQDGEPTVMALDIRYARVDRFRA